MLFFEWDINKAKRNLEVHGVSFEEASTAFKDTLSLNIYDPLYSEDEDRFILIGTSFKKRLVVVIFAKRGDTIRIIFARTPV